MRNPGQCVGFLCDSTSVLEGAVLVQGASNDTVALPSAANSRSRLVGLAYQAGSSTANEAITAVINGIFAGIATGTITRGDRLVIGGATGTVQAESLTTPPDATRVGYALESVSSGERVAVLIGEVPSFSGTVVKFTSSSAILANSIVVLTAASTVGAPAGADPVAGVAGVALNATTGSGETVYVVTNGVASVTDSGSGVTLADKIAVAGATGLGKTAAPGAGANNFVVGSAMATTSASGSIPVLVNPFLMQGA